MVNTLRRSWLLYFSSLHYLLVSKDGKGNSPGSHGLVLPHLSKSSRASEGF